MLNASRVSWRVGAGRPHPTHHQLANQTCLCLSAECVADSRGPNHCDVRKQLAPFGGRFKPAGDSTDIQPEGRAVLTKLRHKPTAFKSEARAVKGLTAPPPGIRHVFHRLPTIRCSADSPCRGRVPRERSAASQTEIITDQFHYYQLLYLGSPSSRGLYCSALLVIISLVGLSGESAVRYDIPS